MAAADGQGVLTVLRWAHAGVVAGLALATVPVVVWSAGGGPAAAFASVASAAPAIASVDTPAAPAGQAAAPARGAVPASAPVRVRLPSIGVDAPVVRGGVDGRGAMEVPPDVRTAGWYRFGPAPGDAAGSSVISGHVDDREQGRGAFYRLADLAPGDPVQVVASTGRVLDYRVRDVRRLPKAGLPVDELFARGGPPRLTLVTCGGPFDRRARSYADNVVATALPVDRPTPSRGLAARPRVGPR